MLGSFQPTGDLRHGRRTEFRPPGHGGKDLFELIEKPALLPRTGRVGVLAREQGGAVDREAEAREPELAEHLEEAEHPPPQPSLAGAAAAYLTRTVNVASFRPLASFTVIR